MRRELELWEEAAYRIN